MDGWVKDKGRGGDVSIGHTGLRTRALSSLKQVLYVCHSPNHSGIPPYLTYPIKFINNLIKIITVGLVLI